MEKTKPASSSKIPTVDLSPFFDGGDGHGRKKAMKIISEACTNLGVFQIKNHCVSSHMCNRLMKLHKKFSDLPKEVKECSTCLDKKLCGTGALDMEIDKFHDLEYLYMLSPETPHNGIPSIPHDYRKTYEEVYHYFLKTAQIVEEIINDCLGLPPNTLKKYNCDRTGDCVLGVHYPPSDETGDIGVIEHEDINLFTLVLEDEICGLEVLVDGEWIPIIPKKGRLIVIIGDCIQVLSNKKFRHVTHRALRNKGRSRHAIDFCYNLAGKEKWVEPLPELTREIGVKPKYKGFYFEDYIKLNNELDANRGDLINLTYYEI